MDVVLVAVQDNVVEVEEEDVEVVCLGIMKFCGDGGWNAFPLQGVGLGWVDVKFLYCSILQRRRFWTQDTRFFQGSSRFSRFSRFHAYVYGFMFRFLSFTF